MGEKASRHATTPPSEAEVREQLERILASEAFRRSGRLKQFLSYVCELTLAGDEGKINEYLIGTDVFGRGDAYSPSEDSIVRRQARALRQKLADYYEGPGAEDTLRIDVPKGGYVPVFQRVALDPVEEAPAEPAEAPQPPVPPPAAAPGVRRLRVALVIAVTAAAFLAGLAIPRRTSAPAATAATGGIQDPALHELWAPWFRADSAVVCFSNPLNVLLKHYSHTIESNGRVFPLDEDRSGLDEVLREFFDLEGGRLYLWPDITAAKMGEAMGAVPLASLFGRAGVPVRATQSRFLSWEDFRRENLIVLGHNEQNPWVDPLLEDYPLQMRAAEGERARRIVNTDPAPGETKEFELNVQKDAPDIEFALVSMLPGIDERRPLLLVGGLNTQVGQAALEFLTDPEGAGALIQRMREAAPDHTGPWFFQAVLRTETRNKVPSTAEIVYVRLLQSQPSKVSVAHR